MVYYYMYRILLYVPLLEEKSCTLNRPTLQPLAAACSQVVLRALGSWPAGRIRESGVVRGPTRASDPDILRFWPD